MQIEQMRYLVAIANSSSLTEASEKLYVSQQALGKSIKSMEQELNVRLLERSNKGCTLTKEGKHVVKQCIDILKKIDELKNTYLISNNQNLLKGELIILCCHTAYQRLLPHVMNAFIKENPNLKITMLSRDSHVIPELHKNMMEANDKAVVVSIMYVLENEKILDTSIIEQFEKIPLERYNLMFCMNRNHKLAKYEKIPIELAIKEEFILTSTENPSEGQDYKMLNYFGVPRVKKVFSASADEYFYQEIANSNCLGFVFSGDDKVSLHEDLISKDMKPKINYSLIYLIDANHKKNVIAERLQKKFKKLFHCSKKV